MAIIWKANRNCTRGTPVRRPPGPRLGDSWWGREETPGLGGPAGALATTTAQPIACTYADAQSTPSLSLSPLFPFLSSSSQPPSLPLSARRSKDRAREEGGGGLGRGRKISCCYGDDRQRRSRAVCWAVVEVVEEGGGCSVSAWKRSFAAAAAAPASRQEVKTVHHFERKEGIKKTQMVSNEVGSLQWENPRRGYF